MNNPNPILQLRLPGRMFTLTRPAVMAIINITPDSFYESSRHTSRRAIAEATRKAIGEGADMIDLGGYSSRPGAENVDAATELDRLALGLEAVREVSTEIPVSVDTFRAEVARRAVEDYGADIINDISGGDLDNQMFETVAELSVPYILMHMRGTPATMQQFTDYSAEGGVIAAVASDLAMKIKRLELLGVADIIADPGLGFAKTVEQNWQLMRGLPMTSRLTGRPLLIGLSRKSMLTRPLGITASEALNATTAANMLALVGGASILRVHDARSAREAVELHQLYLQS